MINKIYKNKKTKKQFLLNSLFQSKNLYGETLNKINKNTLPFIYGIRHNYSIINLKHTINSLKKAFLLIKTYLILNQKILIIGNSLDIKFLLNQQFIKKNKNLIFFKENWINGILVNNNIYIKNFLNKQDIQLIIFLKSEIKEKYILNELFHFKKPIIALINTNTDIKYINYPIIINNKNLKSLFFIMYLFRKII